MDEKRAAFRLSAPACDSFPGVDDHLVEPEVTRDEIINGRRVVAMPALPPHADKQVDLDYLLRAHAAPGYRVAADLLTRHAVDSDFASDACIYKEGVNPATGARHLEEFAFEVVSEQNEKVVREKAAAMHRRGVRRIFAIFVRGRQRVCEWSPEGHGWAPLAAGSRIEDRCLAVPLSVAALLDVASADNAVAEALIAKGNPTILKREDAAESRGKAKGLAQGKVLGILEVRGIAMNLAQRQEILRCQDLDRLDRWCVGPPWLSSAGQVLAEP